jgi:hypothetical protein
MRTITITYPDKSNQVSSDPAIWQVSEQDILIDVSPLPYGWIGDDLSPAILEWDKAGRFFRDHAYARETLLKDANGGFLNDLKEALGYIQDRRTMPAKAFSFKRITPFETPYQVGDRVRVINSGQARCIIKTVLTNPDGFHLYEMMETAHNKRNCYWHHELELSQ